MKIPVTLTGTIEVDDKALASLVVSVASAMPGEMEIDPDLSPEVKAHIAAATPENPLVVPTAPAPSPGNPTNILQAVQPSHPLPLRVEAEQPPKPQHAPATLAKLVAVMFCVSALAVFLFSCGGCATRIVTPATPAQTNALTGVVSPAQPAITNYVPNVTIAQITPAVQAAAPFIPAPYNAIVLALLGLATTVASAIAVNKNNAANTAQASSDTHEAAAASLAATVVAANLQPQALANAATNASTQAVAQHLQNAASPT
jgi:hypothetical protein